MNEIKPRPAKRWTILPQIPAFVEENLSEHPELLRQLLFNRGILNTEQAQVYLNAQGSLYDPFLLKNMDAAVARVWQAIEEHQTIAVYGDYDVDGVTATALLVEVLQAYGANVIGFIPNRFEEGYGLSNEPLQKLREKGTELIITVDCGIRSWDEVEYARSLGMDIIISDHHHPLDKLPEANMVICPKQAEDAYPEKNLAGVGVAFKIAEALITNHPIPDIQIQDILDLVAVGTVADIVPLAGENRALVKAGLKEIHFGRRVGLRSLAGVSRLFIQKINSHHIGFFLGPRLNAAGRLENAQMAYELLITKDPQTAARLAQQLDDRNKERQDLTRRLHELAESLLAEREEKEILMVVHPDFNMGVVGLVASRLVDAHYRPAIVGYDSGDTIRASCRSIPEFNITEALDTCADLFDHHGGHAMAAGFTLQSNKRLILDEKLSELAHSQFSGQVLQPELLIDAEIQLEKTQPKQVFDSLASLEPVGQSNPGAVFCSRNVEVMSYSKVGSDGQHLRLRLKDGPVVYNAIAFKFGYWAAQMPKQIDIAYTFDKNTYRGVEEIQLQIKDIQPAADPA